MDTFMYIIREKLTPETLMKNLPFLLEAWHQIAGAPDPHSRDALMLEFQGRIDALAHGRDIT